MSGFVRVEAAVSLLQDGMEMLRQANRDDPDLRIVGLELKCDGTLILHIKDFGRLEVRK